MTVRLNPWIAGALLGAALLVWVISPVGGVPVYRWLLAAAVAGGLLCACTDARVRPRWRAATMLPMAVFVGLHLLSLVAVAGAPALDFSPSVIDIAASLGVCLMAVGLFQVPGMYSTLIRGVVWASAGLALLLVTRHLIGFEHPFLTPAVLASDLVGGFTRRNQLAFYLALIFPFAWSAFVHRPGWRTVLPPTTLAFAQVYTFSRMGLLLLTLAVLLPVLWAREARGRFAVAAGAVVLVGLAASAAGWTPSWYLDQRWRGQMTVVPNERAEALSRAGEQWVDWNGSRATYLRQALAGVVEAPWLGHGIAAFNRNHSEYRSDGSLIRRSRTHNDYAQVLYELGLTGLVALCALLARALWDTLEGRHVVAAQSDMVEVCDGQLGALAVLAVSLLFINAYQTQLVWVLLAGSIATAPRPD